MGSLPDRALVLRARWLNLILEGRKTVEIRGCNHSCPGPIYLLESKTGRVRGRATLCPARDLTPEEFLENTDAIEDRRYERPRAGPLTDVMALDAVWVVSAPARRGCVTWVTRHRWEKYPVAA